MPADVPSTTSLSGDNIIERFSATTEYFLTALASGNKPWFFVSKDIFTSVKTAVDSIPKNKEILESGLNAICTISEYVHKMTDSKTPVFTVENCHDLISLVDTHISLLLIRLDDGFDEKRGQLSALLRKLITALINHKEFATEIAKDTAKGARAEFTTHSEKMVKLFNALKLEVKAKGVYPVTCEKISSGVTVVQTASKEVVTFIVDKEESLRSGIQGYMCATAAGWGNSILVTAQPYVQTALVMGLPFVDNLVTIGEPYAVATIIKAQPFLAHAQTVAEHPFIHPFVSTQSKRLLSYEPFVTQTVESALVALGEVKSYAKVDDWRLNIEVAVVIA
jgi:hypothetical protein